MATLNLYGMEHVNNAITQIIFNDTDDVNDEDSEFRVIYDGEIIAVRHLNFLFDPLYVLETAYNKYINTYFNQPLFDSLVLVIQCRETKYDDAVTRIYITKQQKNNNHDSRKITIGTIISHRIDKKYDDPNLLFVSSNLSKDYDKITQNEVKDVPGLLHEIIDGLKNYNIERIVLGFKRNVHVNLQFIYNIYANINDKKITKSEFEDMLRRPIKNYNRRMEINRRLDPNNPENREFLEDYTDPFSSSFGKRRLNLKSILADIKFLKKK